MECINHSGVTAAGTCQMCGKALCVPCMNRFNPPACEPCLASHNAGVARRLYMDLGITAAIFIGVALLVAFNVSTNKGGGVVLGLMVAGAYWGWQFLSRISVPVLFTSGAGLTIYLFIKFMLSIFAGFIIAPWQIFKRVKELREIRTLNKDIKAGQA